MERLLTNIGAITVSVSAAIAVLGALVLISAIEAGVIACDLPLC